MASINVFGHSEPVFLPRRDLPSFSGQGDIAIERYDILEIFLAAERVCEKKTILGAQAIRVCGGSIRRHALTVPAADRRYLSTGPHVKPV